MDYQFESEWANLVKQLEEKFQMDIDLQSVLFLIGVQELGHGFKTFSKKEKMDLMHIAICTLLEPHGNYRYSHKDSDGWPHFDVIQKLPQLTSKEQETLMKQAVIDYFNSENGIRIPK